MSNLPENHENQPKTIKDVKLASRLETCVL
jgi:hypothetical protein